MESASPHTVKPGKKMKRPTRKQLRKKLERKLRLMRLINSSYIFPKFPLGHWIDCHTCKHSTSTDFYTPSMCPKKGEKDEIDFKFYQSNGSIKLGWFCLTHEWKENK